MEQKQIVFFEVLENEFGDYLTKYASQGYILNEVSCCMQGDTVVYSGVWDKNIDDQMWSCHFGKSFEQILNINKTLQTSEEGCYLPSRIAKVSHSSKILFTCIWKVPLDYFDEEDHDEEEKEANPRASSATMQGPNSRPDWSSEQQEIIQSMGTENQWKFFYNSVVEYCMSQNSLHERCQKMARLGYRVDQIIGIQHNYVIKGSGQAAAPDSMNNTQRAKLGQMGNNSTLKLQMQKTQQKMMPGAGAISAGLQSNSPLDDSVQLSINQCMSRTVQMQSEIVYSAIWLKNVEHAKYAYLYNQTQSKFFQKFEDCKRHGLSLIQLNIFKTICNQYRFDAVFMQTQLKAIVSPFKGLRIEEFMKIHGSMPDQVQIRSFLTVGGVPQNENGSSKMRGISDMTMTPQPNKYATSKLVNAGLTATTSFEEEKGGTPVISKDIRDIIEDLQNNQLQIYALWSEEGDVHRSFIQQPFRASSLNTISLAQNGRMVGGYHTYGLPPMQYNPSMPGNHVNLQRKKQQLQAARHTSQNQNNEEGKLTDSKPLLLPIKPNHCRQPTMKLPGSANGNFASTLRNGSAPPRKVVSNKISGGNAFVNSSDSNTTATTEATANHSSNVNSNIGILAWPLNNNKPMQRGNGSMFNYPVKRPKNTKFKSPYHKYLHDRIWQDFMLPTNRVGLAMVYAIEGTVVYSEGFGYADFEAQEKMTSNHIMRIASVSKEITDAGLNLLFSNKKLQLTDTLFGEGGILVGDFKHTEDTKKHRYLQMVTVEHCMKHTAGQPWHNLVDDPAFRLNKLDQKQLLQWCIDNRPLTKRPGGQEYYSNIGYLFLGRVIEKVTGMNYCDYITKYIMEPTGVTTFQLGKDSKKDKLAEEATYYSLEFTSSPYSIKVKRADSAFGMVISPQDCVKFAHAWMRPASFFRGGINGTQTFIYNTRRRHQCAIFLNSRTLEKPPYKQLIEEFGRKIPDDQWPGQIS